jgi:hypothetical protein
MAQYKKSVNIWELSQPERKALQVGQWITAGNSGCKFSRGIWCGQTNSGSDVAVWLGNIKSLRGVARQAHIRTLITYANDRK